MKAIKLLIFAIIGVLVIGAVIVTLIYFYTDTFKPTQEIFYKYVSEDNAATIIDTKLLEQLITNIRVTENEQDINLGISAELKDDIVVENQTVNFHNKIDIPNKMIESTITLGNNNNEELFKFNIVRNNNLYGVLINDIMKRILFS